MANYIDNIGLSQTLTYLKKYIDDIATTKQSKLNRTIWGAHDTGGNVSGNFNLNGVANGNLTIADMSTYRSIQTYGSVPLSINPLGNNVGIGTTTPGYKLDVNGTVHVTGLATLGNNLMFSNGNGVYGTRTNGNTGEIISFASDNTVSINKGFFASGDWTKYYGTKHVWFYGITAVTGMFLDSTGYLGIGTTTPTYKLDVNGNGRFASDLYVHTSIRDLNDGIYWNTNVESSTDGSDAASIVLTKGKTINGNSMGTVLVMTQQNDPNDTIQFVTNGNADIYHNDYNIIDTRNYTNYAVARTSAQRPGVTRLYRRDDNSDFSVQTNWTGNYWYLQGYNGDTYHAGVQVDRALSAANADNASSAHSLSVFDTRNSNVGPNLDNTTDRVRFDFKSNGQDGLSDGGAYHGVLTFQQWNDASGGGTRQLGFTDNDNLWIRGSGSALSSYGSWKLFLNSTNFSSYALPLHGTADVAAVASRLGQSGNSGAPMTFNWSGQSGQPSWLWGGNDGTNMYVYNPSNFNVNHANSASNADKLGGFTEASFLRERGNWPDGANARAGLSATGWGSKVNYQTDYGDSLHIQGNNTWYNRLDFGTNGRIYFYQAINPSTLTGCMQYKGALAYLSDTVAASTKVSVTIPAGQVNDLVYAKMAGSDYFRIHVGGASNSGWAEIATAYDGNEPIYVRQYTGAFASITRTLTLLDGNGNTIIPGSLNVGGALVLANNTGLVIKDSAGNAQRTLFISNGDTVYFGCNDSPKYTIFEGSQLQFNYYNSGWQSGMVLDNNGNLNVSGNAHITGTVYTDVGLRSRNICIETESNGNAGTKFAEINVYTNNLFLQHSSSNNLVCCYGGGKVGIGITVPNYKLDVTGDGRFTSDLTAKSFINSSDRNLKENILDINSDYLNKVESVEFMEFNFKDDKSKTKHYGVIAQDLQELGLDDLVKKDLEGNLGVDYISLLILEIKSLKDKLNKLEKKLN